jgi:hypothetical protein
LLWTKVVEPFSSQLTWGFFGWNWPMIHSLWEYLSWRPIDPWSLNLQPWARRSVFLWPDGILVGPRLWYSWFLWFRFFSCSPAVFHLHSNWAFIQGWWSIFFARWRLGPRNIFRDILVFCEPGWEPCHCTKTSKIIKISNSRSGNHTFA